MSNFIYCYDCDYAVYLQNMGYALLKTEFNGDVRCWIFANNASIKTLTFDKSKVRLSDKFTF